MANNSLSKNYFWVILCLFSITVTFSQRSVIGASGGSAILANNHYISYSVGQQGITGTFTNADGKVIQQGFEHGLLRIVSRKTIETPVSIQTTAYPNPFTTSINFSFSKPLNRVVELTVFDELGRLVLRKQQTAINKLSVSLARFSDGVYTITIKGATFNYTTRVIKQN